LEKYQGNKVYGYIVDLEAKGLIKTEKYGRTKLITATPGFEKYFGKSTEEIKQMLSSRVEESGKAEEKEKGSSDEKEVEK
jgi:chromosome segregation and condensation protein ScpB